MCCYGKQKRKRVGEGGIFKLVWTVPGCTKRNYAKSQVTANNSFSSLGILFQLEPQIAPVTLSSRIVFQPFLSTPGQVSFSPSFHLQPFPPAINPRPLFHPSRRSFFLSFPAAQKHHRRIISSQRHLEFVYLQWFFIDSAAICVGLVVSLDLLPCPPCGRQFCSSSTTAELEGRSAQKHGLIATHHHGSPVSFPMISLNSSSSASSRCCPMARCKVRMQQPEDARL